MSETKVGIRRMIARMIAPISPMLLGITFWVVVAAAGDLLGQAETSPTKPRLAVKQVLLPHSTFPGEDLAFSPPLFLGDFNSNGFVDFGVGWFSYDLNGGSSSGTRVIVGDWNDLKSPEKTSGITAENSILASYYPLTSRIALMIGSEAFLTHKDGVDLKASSIRKNGRRLEFNPPHPSVQFESLSRCGDLSGDGDDDFYFFASTGSPEIFVGLFDSTADTSIWLHQDSTRQVHSPFPIQQSEENCKLDINRDGVTDFISAYTLPWQGGGSDFEILYVALSGTDGNVLWETVLGTQAGISAHSIGGDYDGDGVSDLIRLGWFGVDFGTWSYSDLGVVQAVSGLDGSVIWSVPSYRLDPNWRTGPIPGEEFQASRCILPCPDLTGDGVADLLCGALLLTPSSEINGMGFGLFSGSDGRFVRNFEMPSSAFPWSEDELGKASSSDTAVSLGDLDRDGWPELAYLFDAPSFDNDGSSRSIPRGLAILSLPSLISPARAKAGSTFACQVHVPSAPNEGFAVLGSTSFSTTDGLSLGMWNSLLGPSRLLDATKRTAVIRPLDSVGRQEFSVSLPNGTWFTGATLYLRAIVFPSGVVQPPRTITNLSWVIIE